MGLKEKFAAIEISVDTSKSFAQVLAAADDAATKATGMVTSVRREAVHEGKLIQYTVRRIKALVVGDMRVTYTATESGGLVTFKVVSYLTSQSTLLYFIPIGPKESAALPAARTFSRLLREAL